MTVKNNSPEKGKLIEVGTNYEFHYNPITKGDNTQIILNFTSAENLVSISATAPCGCTSAIAIPVSKNEYNLTVGYNSSLIGVFSKTATNVFQEGGRTKTVTIKIKGEVKK